MSTTPARTAAELEASAATSFTVTWREHTFTIPVFEQWDVDILEAAENGKQIASLRLVLGPAQWQAFHDSTPKPVQADVLELSTLIGEGSIGASSLGESGASSAS